ncbi:MAG: ABC transporter permease [Methanosarcinales archaeon]|nr:ABC transporter permease [Methanosarcinales archaeon]
MSPGAGLKADFRAIKAIAQREIIRFLRAKSRIMASISMPLIWFCAFGLGLGSAFGVKYGDMGYAEFLAPGIIAMTVLFASTFSGMSIIVDKEFGILKELLVAPISRVSLVLGKLIGGMATSLIRALLITILFCIILDLDIGVLEFTGIMGIICLIAIGFGGLAIAIATQMESMEGFGLIVELVVMPIFFLSCAFFPIEKLPGWLSTVVILNPLTYGVDALRLIMVDAGNFTILHDISVLIFFDVVIVMFAAYLFSRG